VLPESGAAAAIEFCQAKNLRLSVLGESNESHSALGRFVAPGENAPESRR